MTAVYPSISQCALAATAFKVLLFPAYKSTDFEVHRNWLAITNSLPVKRWYFEDTSEWTLDYPPFFAYFEWALSQGARLVDAEMLKVFNLEYSSWKTTVFQRASVIVTELLLVYALHLYVRSSNNISSVEAHAIALSILLSPGLLIIDHIHFQYNGVMYGLLIVSLVLGRKKNTMVLSGILFAALLCMKHIYLYLAPAYFVYLLRAYCLRPNSMFQLNITNTTKLGVGVTSIFGLALGPFVYWQQLPQLMSRLFPFARGLCHAYWAPNIWAIYSLLDRVLIQVAPKFGLVVDNEAINSVTRGLVGDTAFAILPEITARTTFSLTMIFQIIPLIKLFREPSWEIFISALTLCGYASFLFGWHVHEKAVLLIMIPFSLIALRDRRYLGAFRPLAVAGHFSLFPLLYTTAEFPIKSLYTIFWLVLFLTAFDRLAPASRSSTMFVFDRVTQLYIALSIPFVAYTSFIHQVIFQNKYEFLPLMLNSSYAAVGIVGSWLLFLSAYFSG